MLHSIILYQNGHSGAEPPQIVSTATFPERLRFFVLVHAVSAFFWGGALKFSAISQRDY